MVPQRSAAQGAHSLAQEAPGQPGVGGRSLLPPSGALTVGPHSCSASSSPHGPSQDPWAAVLTRPVCACVHSGPECARACVRARVCECMCACVCACTALPQSVRACAWVCVCAHLLPRSAPVSLTLAELTDLLRLTVSWVSQRPSLSPRSPRCELDQGLAVNAHRGSVCAHQPPPPAGPLWPMV